MKIKELRTFYDVQQKELATVLSISPNTLSQYENGKREPGIEIVSKIANYFNISVDYVYGTSSVNTCKKCGLTYDPLDNKDKSVHDELHTLWEKAVIKHGNLYCNTVENEKIKAENRNIVHNLSLPLSERYNAQLLVFRCLFSRSLEASNFSDKHIDFSTYISMLLNNENTEKNLDSELFNVLVEEYGKRSGISNGETYFYAYDNEYSQDAPLTIAAHFDGSEYTEEELNEIRQFADFVKNKRK